MQSKNNTIDKEPKELDDLISTEEKQREQMQAENGKLMKYISTKRENQKKKGFFRSIFSKY